MRIQLVLAGVFGAAALATLLWPTWIENLTGLEPDAGTGETEWWLVAILGLAAIISAALALRDRRAIRAATVGS
jgi:LPXTG-motif cell wall-anchored protein